MSSSRKSIMDSGGLCAMERPTWSDRVFNTSLFRALRLNGDAIKQSAMSLWLASFSSESSFIRPECVTKNAPFDPVVFS